MKTAIIVVSIFLLLAIIYLLYSRRRKSVSVEVTSVDITPQAPIIKDASQRVSQSTITGYRPKTGVNFLASK